MADDPVPAEVIADDTAAVQTELGLVPVPDHGPHRDPRNAGERTG